jgi:hypothetical protein
MMKTNAELRAAYDVAYAAYYSAAEATASPLHFVCPERR